MATDQQHEDLLKDVLDQVVQSNRQLRPGTPMAELKAAIEQALTSLPPLEFEEYTRAIGDAQAGEALIQHAPDIIGWNADKIVEWIGTLTNKMDKGTSA